MTHIMTYLADLNQEVITTRRKSEELSKKIDKSKQNISEIREKIADIEEVIKFLDTEDFFVEYVDAATTAWDAKTYDPWYKVIDGNARIKMKPFSCVRFPVKWLWVHQGDRRMNRSVKELLILDCHEIASRKMGKILCYRSLYLHKLENGVHARNGYITMCNPLVFAGDTLYGHGMSFESSFRQLSELHKERRYDLEDSHNWASIYNDDYEGLDTMSSEDVEKVLADCDWR